MTSQGCPLRRRSRPLEASSVGILLIAHALLLQAAHAHAHAHAYAHRPPSDASDALAFTGGHRGYLTDLEGGEDPELILEILGRLGQTVARANDMRSAKRGLDLGVSRGFSGSQAAKHLMGLAAANYAGGPGRRRRSPHA